MPWEGRQPGPDPRNPPKIFCRIFVPRILHRFLTCADPPGQADPKPGLGRIEEFRCLKSCTPLAPVRTAWTAAMSQGPIWPGQGQSETATFICLACCSYFDASSRTRPEGRGGDPPCPAEFLCLKCCTLSLPDPVPVPEPAERQCKFIYAPDVALCFHQDRTLMERPCGIILPQILHFILDRPSQASARTCRPCAIPRPRKLHFLMRRRLAHKGRFPLESKGISP